MLQGVHNGDRARSFGRAPSFDFSVWRLVGVIFSPKTTFADIVRKPSWLLPVILLAVLGAIVAVSLHRKMDWREYMSQQIEKSPRAASLSAEQKQQQIEVARSLPRSVPMSSGFPHRS